MYGESIVMIKLIISITILLLSSVVHELAHYITARASGVNAKLGYCSMGLCVRIPGLERYSCVTELPDYLKIKYVLTALAPYIILPAYYIMYMYGVLIKPVFEVILIYHLFSLPFEFYQKNQTLPLIAGVLQVTAIVFLALLY